MENIALVRKYLGGAKLLGSPKSELDFVPIIRAGLPCSVFTSLGERAKLSEETICTALRIAKRTAARRKSQSARLTPKESELLFRLARVLVAAGETLGSEAKASAWLLAENRALGGSSPIKLLDTGIGFQEVLDTLRRIEYGVFS